MIALAAIRRRSGITVSLAVVSEIKRAKWGVGNRSVCMSAAMKHIAAPSVRLRRTFIGIRPFDEAGDHRARSGRFDTSGKSPFVTNGRICDHLTEQVLEFLCAVHF